jgi:nucleotide-binding universal stress UspA family protein
MIGRILCPTDLTENSRDSMAYALRLAKENRAELIVFHATSLPNFPYDPCELEPYYPWEELLSKFNVDRVLAAGERKMKHFVGVRFRSETDGVVWKSRITLGKPSEEIVTAAFQEEVDLIVMARCKGTRVARIFTPSIAEAVSRYAPCPVLSIDATHFVRPSPGWKLPLLREIFQS